MKNLFILIILLLNTYTTFAQNDVHLVASGEGKNKEEATYNALRSAIEQTFGTFVSANTTILDDKMVVDEIVSLSSGSIKKYEYITIDKLPNGNTYATLSVDIAVNKLVSFAKSKGSECEFAGANFGANIKMYNLYIESSKKVLTNLKQQCVALAPFLYDYELEVGEPQIDDSGTNGIVKFKVKVLANENTKNFGKLVQSTLEALEIDSIYAKQLNAMGIGTILFSPFTGQRKIGKPSYYLKTDVFNIFNERNDTVFGSSSNSYYCVLNFGKYHTWGVSQKERELIFLDRSKHKFLPKVFFLSKPNTASYYFSEGIKILYKDSVKECCFLYNQEKEEESFLYSLIHLQERAYCNYVIKDNLNNEYGWESLSERLEYVYKSRSYYPDTKNYSSYNIYFYDKKDDRMCYRIGGVCAYCTDSYQATIENVTGVEVYIDTDYDKGDICFIDEFFTKIPLETLSKINKFKVERKNDKF